MALVPPISEPLTDPRTGRLTLAWHKYFLAMSVQSGAAISGLTGDVTATGPGTVAATVTDDTSTQRVTIDVNGVEAGTRSTVNLLNLDDEISVSAVTNAAANEVQLSIQLTSLAERFRRLLRAYVDLTGDVPSGLEDDWRRSFEEIGETG